MCDRRHSALLTVIVPLVIEEIVRGYGIDEKTATERFYASRVYAEIVALFAQGFVFALR